MSVCKLSLLLTAFAFCTANIFAATATVDVLNEVAGKTPKYIGYNYGHYMPGSNTSAWIERSKVNCFRVWAGPTYYEPNDDAAPWGDGVTNSTTFEARKAALRNDPLNPSYINWNEFNWRFETY